MESGDLGSRPMYMEVMEDAKADMERIQKAMDDLSQLHKEHLKVHFDAGDEDEQQIDILTGKIKGMFKSCESKVKSIGIPPVHGVERSADEEAMRKNIQRSLAAHLTEQGAEFRKQQRAYLQKLKTQKDRQRQFSDAFGENEDEEKSERIKEIEQKIYDPSFTEEQIAQMILQETLIEERDKEIREIAQSIAEIADMFKDLNQLVIEQGTILDRIDANRMFLFTCCSILSHGIGLMCCVVLICRDCGGLSCALVCCKTVIVLTLLLDFACLFFIFLVAYFFFFSGHGIQAAEGSCQRTGQGKRVPAEVSHETVYFIDDIGSGGAWSGGDGAGRRVSSGTAIRTERHTGQTSNDNMMQQAVNRQQAAERMFVWLQESWRLSSLRSEVKQGTNEINRDASRMGRGTGTGRAWQRESEYWTEERREELSATAAAFFLRRSA